MCIIIELRRLICGRSADDGIFFSKPNSSNVKNCIRLHVPPRKRVTILNSYVRKHNRKSTDAESWKIGCRFVPLYTYIGIGTIIIFDDSRTVWRRAGGRLPRTDMKSSCPRVVGPINIVIWLFNKQLNSSSAITMWSKLLQVHEQRRAKPESAVYILHIIIVIVPIYIYWIGTPRDERVSWWWSRDGCTTDRAKSFPTPTPHILVLHVSGVAVSRGVVKVSL